MIKSIEKLEIPWFDQIVLNSFIVSFEQIKHILHSTHYHSHTMESKFYLFNQGDRNSDPLPEEDEETDDDEEDDADHRGEREPSISLLQEIVHYFWSPVQLHMHMKARHLDSVSE